MSVVRRLIPLLEFTTMGRKRDRQLRSRGISPRPDPETAAPNIASGSERSSLPLRVLRLLPFTIASVMLLPWNLP